LAVFGNLYHQKKTVFDNVFSILVLLKFRDGSFQKKENTHPNLVLVLTKKNLSLIGRTVLEKRGENLWSFLALVAPKAPGRRHLRTLSQQNVYIYTICVEIAVYYEIDQQF